MPQCSEQSIEEDALPSLEELGCEVLHEPDIAPERKPILEAHRMGGSVMERGWGERLGEKWGEKFGERFGEEFGENFGEDLYLMSI